MCSSDLLDAAMRTVLKDVADLRNSVAHRPPETVAPSEVESILQTVRVTLCLLDFYRGFAWAADEPDLQLLIRQMRKNSSTSSSA